MPPKFVRVPASSDRDTSRDIERRALLDGNSDEEDFFLSGPRVETGQLRSDPKINKLRSQVDDVVGVMKDNVGKVLERGDRLEDLQDKSDSLATHSDLFRVRSKNLHRAMWWKNCRMRIIVALVVLVVLGIIIIPIIVHYSNN